MNKIFISHASSDEFIAKQLIDDILIGSLSVNITEIFCTSTDGTKIESGEDWRNSIETALTLSNIIILIITPNYKESEVCICEMGAAWVTRAKVISYIIEPINYSNVGIIQEPKQVEKLLDQGSLDRLKDIIQSTLSIPHEKIKSDRWTVKKNEFINKIEEYLSSTEFNTPIDRVKFNKLLEDNQKSKDAFKLLISDKIKLEKKINDLKKLKDADDVKEFEMKHMDIKLIKQFEEICSNISVDLNTLQPIVIGIIFIDYSQKNISVSSDGYTEKIDEAISKDIITDSLEVDWDTTKNMRKLSKHLKELSDFLNNYGSFDDFIEMYENKYTAPISISNIDFWEECFDQNIYIS